LLAAGDLVGVDVSLAVDWSVYIARCADDTLYVGIARDVRARIAKHDAGRGARYTRGRGPLRVLATRRCRSQGDALRLERALKNLARQEKLAVASSRSRLARLARACAGALRESEGVDTRGGGR
jgi:putative endonuclease